MQTFSNVIMNGYQMVEILCERVPNVLNTGSDLHFFKKLHISPMVKRSGTYTEFWMKSYNLYKV